MSKLTGKGHKEYAQVQHHGSGDHRTSNSQTSRLSLHVQDPLEVHPHGAYTPAAGTTEPAATTRQE